MRAIKSIALGTLLLFFADSKGETKGAAFTKKVQLYVGTGSCNAGEITIDSRFKGCSTRAIGFTVNGRAANESNVLTELFVGNEIINKNIVSNNPRFLGGENLSIGFLTNRSSSGATKVYRGIKPCSDGTATLHSQFGGCRTVFLGYSTP
jgi:hypothetical protein